jgi:hypothetical protein
MARRVGVFFICAASAACPNSSPPHEVTPTRALDASVGPRERHDVPVTKSPATPDSCWDERPCSGGRVCTTLEDLTIGGCAAPGCREMNAHRGCRNNLDCLSGYSCVLRAEEWQCEEINCTADADCLSRNLRCAQGRCTSIACKTSAECDGYCTMGGCAARPNVCVVPKPPQKFQ